jgi:hypothetical protein
MTDKLAELFDEQALGEPRLGGSSRGGAHAALRRA